MGKADIRARARAYCSRNSGLFAVTVLQQHPQIGHFDLMRTIMRAYSFADSQLRSRAGDYHLAYAEAPPLIWAQKKYHRYILQMLI